MNNRQPEVSGRQPLFRPVTQYLLDIGAHKIDPLVRRIRLSPCLPNNTRNMSHDVFDPASMHLQFIREFVLFLFCAFPFGNNRKDYKGHE